MRPGIQNNNQRVGVFIDVANLYHSAKNLYHGRVNYRELIRYLVGDRQLVRSLAYVVKSEGVEGFVPRERGEAPRPPAPRAASAGPAPSSSEAAFFDALIKSGLESRLKD